MPTTRVRSTAVWVGVAVAVVVVWVFKDAFFSSGSAYNFVHATPRGTLIAPDERKPAPSGVSGTLLNGGTFTLSGERGKVVVVNFWGTWCGPCTTEVPQFDSLYRQVHSQGIDFVGIDTNDYSPGAPQAFVTDNHISYPMVFDEQAKVGLELGNLPINGLPITVLIDREQRVAAVYVGAVLPADMRTPLATLAAET